ncbi:MAG TPA: glycogen synthase GlgA [candidate division Zixibacteria bacterium]|nr:glycogen synthase GlgA [candidate division Zixibacteria bacterium]
MRIAMFSPEIAPFAKTGGLGDVVGTLAAALERQGHQLYLVLPAYRVVLAGGFSLAETGERVSGSVSGRAVQGEVLKTALGERTEVFLIRADRYFDREALYGTAGGDYPDNAERFVFFCRAALELLRRRPVDLLHCHDWQAALGIVFLRAQPERYPELAPVKTVFTIHNLGFQGIFPETDWPLLELDRRFFSPRALEFYGRINFLKGALVFADKITTVSPSYAREIMETEQGFGLQGVLRERAADLTGILNGVDYGQWNPETDPFIAAPYGPARLEGKRRCKESLARELGLPYRPDRPLIGMISRLTSQKGFDLVQSALERLLDRELQLVLLGSGEERYERFFVRAAERFPEKLAVRIGFDEALAHRIEAGADLFLMPSLYEPCGLNQMFSLKYGTLPIVRAVGGLRDTVSDYDPSRRTGTGFVFEPYEPEALLGAVDRALRAFADPEEWAALQRRAMSADFSWERSSRAYSALYRELVGLKSG